MLQEMRSPEPCIHSGLMSPVGTWLTSVPCRTLLCQMRPCCSPKDSTTSIPRSRRPAKNRRDCSYRDARCGYTLNSARHCRAIDLRSSSSIGNSTQVTPSPNAPDAHDGRASSSKYTRSMGRFTLRTARNSRLGSIKPQVVGNPSVSTNASIQDASRSAS
jgi:hypothetical protein